MLTEEELITAHELRLKRDAAKSQRHRKRKCEENEELFLRNNLQQHMSWTEQNSGRVNKIAAGVHKKTKDEMRFRARFVTTMPSPSTPTMIIFSLNLILMLREGAARF